jgi:hypothetical protein
MATIRYILRKHKYLRATHRALIRFAGSINYKLVKVPGAGGAHASNGFDFFEIHVGKNQSLEDRIITFAHELGHALDYVHSPIGFEERTKRMADVVDLQAVSREVAAWGYGQKILTDMNCYRFVVDRFEVMRNHGLGTYNKALEKEDKTK